MVARPCGFDSLLRHQQFSRFSSKFPFGFGEVEASAYYLTLFFILVVLTVAFAAAHAQQIRAGKLAHIFIDSHSDRTEIADLNSRDFYDMLRLPSVNRVAPLAQMIKGRYQFHQTGAKCPIWRRVVSVFYYVLPKLTSWVVYFIVPGFALLFTYHRVQTAWVPWQTHDRGIDAWALSVGALTATLTLLHVFTKDVIYSIVDVLPQIWGDREGSTEA